MRSWSYGEVRKPETINYRTFKPERDGYSVRRYLALLKITNAYAENIKDLNIEELFARNVVEVTLSKVRRDRMGHIELASPVAHIWYPIVAIKNWAYVRYDTSRD